MAKLSLPQRKKKREKKAARLARQAAAVGTEPQPVPIPPVARFGEFAGCWINRPAWETEPRHAVVARRLPGGGVRTASFLVDTCCLGVKDAFWRDISVNRLKRHVEKIQSRHPMDSIDPAQLRRLLDDAVAYARRLGLEPHPDYASGAALLEDVPPDPRPGLFTFGLDGKPLFIPGPYCTAREIQGICEALTRACGPEGFHYVIGL